MLPDRKKHRLKDYDYTQNGLYYVTICTYDRELLFVGPRRDVAYTIYEINENGKIVQDEWTKIEQLRNNIVLDEYVIMPNHIHGIIIINDTATSRRGPTGKFGKPISGSLSTIIGLFKTAVTKRINQKRNTPGKSVWQKSFYDHVIRNDTSLQNIREYIRNNPLTWDNDEENTNKIKTSH
ncbi:MAG: transposase [Candidatus Omnitrophota bacterium]